MTTSHNSDEFGYYQSPAAGLLWAARALAVVALAIASYLLWISASGGTAPGCNDLPGLDCAHVLASQWSRWFNLPVSLLAILVYSGTFVATLAIGPRSSEQTQRDAWKLLVILAVSAGAAGCWFLALQALVLKNFCPYCCAVHACGILLAGFVLWRSPTRWRSLRSGRIRDPMIIKPRTSWSLALLGLVGPALLAGGQLVAPAPGLQLQEYAAAATESDSLGTIRKYPPEPVFVEKTSKDLNTSKPATTNPVKPAPIKTLQPVVPDKNSHPPIQESKQVKPPTKSDQDLLQVPKKSVDLPVPQRRLSLLNGKESIDAYQQPRLGLPQANYVLVEVYDYACPHCRALYPFLEEARKRYGEQFTVVLLPSPLNKDCNSYVKYPHFGHEDACHYARFALALWRVNPAAFEKFHAWMFETNPMPSAEAAKTRAEELIGAGALAKALTDEAIGRQIEENGRIWSTDSPKSLPKLLWDKYSITGEAKNAQELFQFLEKALGVKPKAP